MHASFCSRLQTAWFVIFVIAFSGAFSASNLRADDSLHKRIDQTLAASAIGPVAGPVDDLTFVRRIHLDLTGRIPSIETTRAFLANPAANRRVQLVDQLIASNDFNQHLAVTFDLMLMERRGGKYVKSDDLRAWLRTSFENNKPFHQLASELIAAKAIDGNQAPTAFVLERDVEPNLLTREVARTFFGMDLQCAQCHDHPNVDDYKQEDYYGLYAFVNRSSLFRPDKKKPAIVAESADGLAPFKSVFTNREAFTSPRIPGEAEIVEPVFNAGDEYQTQPSKTTAGVPKYSRRAKLAELMGNGSNDYFRRNIANRLWAMVMGRGLVHPVDMHHSMNPPSHPELMSLLASEIAVMKFDVKAFIRELVLTDVYQRSHLSNQQSKSDPEHFAAAIDELKKRKQAADADWSVKDAEALQAMELLDEAIAAAEPIRATWVKARTTAVAAAKKRFDSTKALEAKKKAATAQQALLSNLNAALTKVQSASNLLGKPADLTKIGVSLTAITTKTKAAADKLDKELAAAEKAAATATAALAKSQTADSTERDKLAPLHGTMRKHRTILVKALKESQQVNERVTNAEQEVEFLQQLSSRASAVTKIPAVRAEIVSVDKQRADTASTITAASHALKLATEKMTTTAARRQKLDTSNNELQQQLQTRQQASGLLAKALSKAKSAATTIQADEAMKSVVAQLEESSVRVDGMMGETMSRLEATGAELKSALKQIEDLKKAMADATLAANNARSAAAKYQQQLDDLRKQLSELESTQKDSNTAITQNLARRFHVANLEALSPEQLAWSVIQASGQFQRQVVSELAKINKKTPLKEEQKTDAILAQRTQEAETAATAALNKTIAGFVTLFAAQKGQPQDGFFATVDQALFFTNGSQLRGWLSPSGNNLTARLTKMESVDKLAEELYLATLIRKPTTEETGDVAEYLTARGKDKSAAVQELAWALITSVEFRFQ